jgi:hypothetical protein
MVRQSLSQTLHPNPLTKSTGKAHLSRQINTHQKLSKFKLSVSPSTHGYATLKPIS